MAAAGPDVPSGRHEAVTEMVIDVAPEDAEIRKSRGDVEKDGRFFLPETLDGVKRREEIVEALRQAEAAAPTAQPDAEAVAKKWTSGAAAKSERTVSAIANGRDRLMKLAWRASDSSRMRTSAES